MALIIVRALAAGALMALASGVQGQIKIGVTVSATGPAASLNAIPQALKSAQPGTREFRRALLDALEETKGLEVTNGAVNMSKTDHLGLDSRARVMVQIQNGKWVLQN